MPTTRVWIRKPEDPNIQPESQLELLELYAPEGGKLTDKGCHILRHSEMYVDMQHMSELSPVLTYRYFPCCDLCNLYILPTRWCIEGENVTSHRYAHTDTFRSDNVSPTVQRATALLSDKLCQVWKIFHSDVQHKPPSSVEAVMDHFSLSCTISPTVRTVHLELISNWNNCSKSENTRARVCGMFGFVAAGVAVIQHCQYERMFFLFKTYCICLAFNMHCPSERRTFPDNVFFLLTEQVGPELIRPAKMKDSEVIFGDIEDKYIHVLALYFCVWVAPSIHCIPYVYLPSWIFPMTED